MRFVAFLSRQARDQRRAAPLFMTFREISLGFPEQTIPKWLNGYVYECVQDGLLRCHMRKAFNEVEFHNWKEVVR